MPVPIYQETALPTSGTAPTPSNAGVYWQNPSRITAKDGSSATVNLTSGGDFGAVIRAASFNWTTRPDNAVIVGLMVRVKGAINQGGIAAVTLNIPGAATWNTTSLDGTWGGPGYLWGLDSISEAQLAALQVNITFSDNVTGGADASLDYVEVTPYWSIELPQPPSPGLPTTFSYKVFSRDGQYLGDLPAVTSPFTFTQDINSAGALLKTVCEHNPMAVTTTDPILDSDGNAIQDNNDLDILGSSTYTPVRAGNDPEPAMFKNGNRLKVFMFNQWWPNGKLMFSGQMNRIEFPVGGEHQITITSYSDGMDLENYIARGFPFSYTNDQAQTSQTGWQTLIDYNPGWTFFGQSFTTGVSAPNVGMIQLLLQGSADVTVRVYDSANLNMLGMATRQVIGADGVNPTQFNFPQLIPTANSTPYFFSVSVGAGQSILLGFNSAGGYAGGQAYQSDYGGGSGGGSYYPISGDLWFRTGIGTPTTTTTYTADDPVSEMAAGILADYNQRGGRIFARDLVPAGYTLTYTFNQATINGAIQKILELAPDGYFAFVDLGDSEIDIGPTSTNPDFIVVLGRDIASLNLALTIERVYNTLLFSGGDTGGGQNLFRQYQDTESAQYYDQRLASKSDNRVTLDATANAIGASFIGENSSEVQETTITLLNEKVDITQYTPGKVLGFQNGGDLVDSLLLQIVRRTFTKDAVTLTIGRLPITQTAEVQRLNRELLDEQTVANPTAPS